MNCPCCSAAREPTGETDQGYDAYRCRCGRKFNERTGTPFNLLELPTDVFLQVVRWRYRYPLSLRDLVEMFLERGFEFTHETVRIWEQRFGALSD